MIDAEAGLVIDYLSTYLGMYSTMISLLPPPTIPQKHTYDPCWKCLYPVSLYPIPKALCPCLDLNSFTCYSPPRREDILRGVVSPLYLFFQAVIGYDANDDLSRSVSLHVSKTDPERS